jgi:hypothetical protein
MPNSGTVVIFPGDPPDGQSGRLLYLYTHWCGDTLALSVQAALNEWMEERGHDLEYGPDHAYLSRVIFCAMVEQPETPDRVTGFGISVYPIVNSGRPLIVLDCEARTVGFARPAEEDFDAQGRPPKCFAKWSFEEYCTLVPSRLEAAARWRQRRH